MARLVVNDVELTVDPALQTWGDLLTVLDADLAAAGEVVTAARLDGVDEPTYREPDFLDKKLAEVEHVDIEAGSPSELARRSVDEAAIALESLRAAARRIGTDFRGHDVSTANRDLSALSDGLRILVTTIHALAQILHLDLNGLDCDGEPAETRIEAAGEALRMLIEAHETEDWITVADVLEYDLDPALGSWRPLLDRFRHTIDHTELQPEQ